MNLGPLVLSHCGSQTPGSPNLLFSKNDQSCAQVAFGGLLRAEEAILGFLGPHEAFLGLQKDENWQFWFPQNMEVLIFGLLRSYLSSQIKLRCDLSRASVTFRGLLVRRSIGASIRGVCVQGPIPFVYQGANYIHTTFFYNEH